MPRNTCICQTMSSASEKFYRSLDSHENEIRLLQVNPGIADEPLQCRLEHVTLSGDTSPQYETVSCVWGDKTRRGTNYVNSHSMDVHKSAELAVRRMRLPNRSRTLWIDAICIDQDSITERSQQVSIMHRIYQMRICESDLAGERRGRRERSKVLCLISKVSLTIRREKRRIFETLSR
jgi:hypothetical protein